MKRLFLFGIVLFLFFLASQALCIPQGCLDSPILGTFMAISSFIAIASGLYAYSFHGFRSVQGKSLLLLSLAVLMLFIGNAVMTSYQALFGINSPPAEAVVFWLMQYPFYIAGLYLIWKMMKAPISRKRLAAMYSLVAVISILGVLAFMTSIPKSLDSNSILAQVSVFGDTLTLDMLVIIAAYSLGGKVFKLWSTIMLSIFILGISHIIVSTNTSSNIVLGLYMFEIGYLVMAFGFLYNREMFRGMVGNRPRK